MIPKHDHKERQPSGVVGWLWRLAGYFSFEGILFAMAVTTDKRSRSPEGELARKQSPVESAAFASV